MAKTRNDEAYERGFKDGKSGGMFDDVCHNLGHVLDSGKEDEIYNKGYDEGAKHRHDTSSSSEDGGDSDSSSDSACYLTTACIMAKGLPDNCLELSVLRRFRDNVLLPTVEGEKAVNEYYKIAPEILQSIRERDHSLDVLRGIYSNIRHAVSLIASKDFDGAFRHYKNMTLRLKREYLD